MRILRWVAVIVVGFLAAYSTLGLAVVLVGLMAGRYSTWTYDTALFGIAIYAILAPVLWALTRRIWRGGHRAPEPQPTVLQRDREAPPTPSVADSAPGLHSSSEPPRSVADAYYGRNRARDATRDYGRPSGFPASPSLEGHPVEPDVSHQWTTVAQQRTTGRWARRQSITYR